ncbi:MAG TPA: cyclase family protein [Chloroflexota bacterium]|nr:cyclase family protein [Chloroflexota bacterium]
MHIYDLSQPIRLPMSYYPTDPAPGIHPWPSTPPWQVTELHLGSHSGTHIDAPSHYGFRQTLSDLPSDRFIGRGIVIDVRGKGPDDLITLDDLGPARSQVEAGAWAIFRTGWDQYWGAGAYLTHPSLDRALTEQLVAWHVPLIGIDALNPDSTQRGEAFVHDILLGAGTLIVENLTGLEQLQPGTPYTFSMLPLKLAGLDGSPIRAVAWDD